MRIVTRLACLILLAAVAGAPAAAQMHVITAQRNLHELQQQSKYIVVGRVIGARIEPHPQYTNLMTVVVTFRVSETLKGDPGKVLTFRQFIGTRSSVRGKRPTEYLRGQEMLLFLHGENEAGFTTPVGIEQGRFRLLQQGSNVVAVNGRSNAGLMNGMARLARDRGVELDADSAQLLQTHQAGPIRLDVLTRVVQRFARTE